MGGLVTLSELALFHIGDVGVKVGRPLYPDPSALKEGWDKSAENEILVW